jgi:Uncharacterized conserved protein (COG2071)
MLHLLKRHPLSVQAHFDFVLSITYALPPATLLKFLPPGLRLDEWNGLGFVAAAFVQTRGLRPVLFPEFAGRSYFFGGYRVFCRFVTKNGNELRGLKIIRSDTDKKIMVTAGNLLAHYNYHLAEVDVDRRADLIHLRIASLDGNGDTDLIADIAACTEFLPDGSPFSNVHEARRFAGPTPFTFAYEPETNSIIRVQGLRRGWKPRLIPVAIKKLSFFDQETFADVKPVVASCFYMEGIDYNWKRGVREQLVKNG